VDSERAPAYAPADGEDEMTPLGYIPQVNHTYAYWDLNYGMRWRLRWRLRCRVRVGHADTPHAQAW
jgi:hypothetical protein